MLTETHAGWIAHTQFIMISLKGAKAATQYSIVHTTMNNTVYLSTCHSKNSSIFDSTYICMQAPRIMRSPIVLLLLATLCATLAVDQAIEDEEIRAEEFLAGLNVELNRQANQIAEASWAYGSNITDHNERVKNDVMTAGAAFSKVSTSRCRTKQRCVCHTN